MGHKKDYSKLQSHEACPRFSHCEKNKCPLHKNFYKLKSFMDDPDGKRCDLAKNIRKRTAKIYNLSWQGLTEKELSARRKWDNLSQKEKDRRIALLKKNSPVTQLLASGHTIIPPGKKQPSNPLTNQKKTTETQQILGGCE